ncbi:MAG TPA: hypothetical protein VMV41_02480 [Cellulomonadaceae bacterium]|nr:hypothetical protein [Cellulomonadaceae bacterium]
MSAPSAPAGVVPVRPVRPAARRRRRTAAATAGIAVLVATLLAGCTGRPGAAAIVDGRAISVADVQQATTELQPYFQSVDQGTVLMLLIGAPTIESIASSAGLAVSDQQAIDLLDSAATSAGAKTPPTFGAPAIEVIKFSLAQKAIEGAANSAALVKQVNDQLLALHAEVSPRYGTVDLSQGSITPISYDWIVKTPTAGATTK